MPIVGRLKMSDKQTILTQFTRKNVDFFFDIFRLEKGIFHPNIGEKKRFGIGNIIKKRLLSKYMKQTIIMSRYGNWKSYKYFI